MMVRGSLMFLACPNRCSTNRFELWNASVFVDPLGRYLEHKAVNAPLYRCTECGSPAVDLGEVPEAMAADRAILENPPGQYACPACEALFSAPRDQSPVVCPACGQTFPVGEGS
jgi:DNA-directed RNA polymerase subunit RPC12/RpoP